MILKLIKIENLSLKETLIEFEKQFQSAIKYRLISDVLGRFLFEWRIG